jgi:phosphoribosyl 1,2-cyclic phosphodiesterase
VRFSILASGSSGNAVYLESENTKLLVDGGLSGREIEKRFFSIGVNPSHLDGILVTHEHADHIQGVGILSRRFGLPVYIHPETLKACQKRLGDLSEAVPFEGGLPFEIGDLKVHPFSIPHDAVNPMGFTFSNNGKKIGLATDMGYVPTLVRERLLRSHALILESNHDLEMLKVGPYAWPLKQRIMGRTGHLSNHDAGALLQDLIHDDLECVVLAHLSEVNNLPLLAYQKAEDVIRRSGKSIRLETARQSETVDLIEIRNGSGSSRHRK